MEVMKKQKKYNGKKYIRKGMFLSFLIIFTVSLFARDIGEDNLKKMSIIEGKIMDAATRRSLEGARVLSMDGSYSAMAREDGTFKIEIPASFTMVLITAPGYSDRIYFLQGKTDGLEIVLYPAVFTNYYENILTPLGEEPNISSVNASVSTGKFTNYASSNISSHLQGSMGGDMRVITHSGAPGIGASMFVRGFNSLNANAEPLIVVDGVIWERPLDKTSIHQGYSVDPLVNLDVNDIESVTLIKDGTSLYGSKGGNGVLLVKTKRGRDIATRVTFSSNVGLNTRPDFIPMMNAEQYRIYASDLMQGLLSSGSYIDKSFLDNNPNSLSYKKYHNNTDWRKEVYRNSLVHSYHIAVNGGDEVALYNLSVGYSHAESTMKKNDFSRLNARFNTDISLSSRFKLRFDLSYSQTDRNLRDDGIAQDPDMGPTTSPGFLSYIKSPFLAPYKYSNQGFYSSNLEDYDFVDLANPVAVLDLGEGTSQHNRFDVNVLPRYHFTDQLALQTHFSYSYINMSEHYYRPLQGFAPFYNNWYRLDNQVKTQFVKQQSIYSNTSVDWKKIINGNSIALTGGFRYMTDVFKGDFASGYNTGSDHIKEMTKSLVNTTMGGYDDEWKSMSWYADAGYNYRGKYYLNGSLSLEGSSRFGDEVDDGIKLFGVRYAVFPSVNAAWLISTENFMRAVPAISLMKIRAGYGISGNDGIDNYASMTYFTAIRYLYKSTGLHLENIANPKIRWETVKKFNVGADVNLFNDRLYLSADYYNSRTENLLTLKDHNYITGLKSYWTNGGELSNTGFELSAKVKAVNLRDFQWELGVSIARYKNKIKSLPDGDYSSFLYGAEIRTMVGKPAGLFYGYKTEGIYSTTNDALDADNGGGLYMVSNTGAHIPFSAGDVRFIDTYKDGLIDENDKTVIGDPNPDFTGTITNAFKYKRFTMNVLFTYSYGNDVFNYQRSLLESGSTLYNQTANMLGRWQTEGQNAVLPKSVYGDPMGNNRFSDRWIEDGSYFRLKNLSVSYDLPVQSRFFQGILVWVSATNLFTLTKYLGTDPESSLNGSVLYQGIDAGLISQGRSYYLGVKINL